MTMRKLIPTTLIALGLVFGLAACDKGGADKKADKQAKADKSGADKNAAGDKADEQPAGEDADAAPALDPKVEQAVTVANMISANPEETDVILADAGLDREGFEKLLYEIAKDPELSKSYAVAREA